MDRRMECVAGSRRGSRRRHDCRFEVSNDAGRAMARSPGKLRGVLLRGVFFMESGSMTRKQGAARAV
eukprot:310098-Prymnesium_polylepis.2